MKLFEKGKIGTLELANRVYMAPMGATKDIDGGYSQRSIDYYTERAKGGVGLIFTAANQATDKFEARAGYALFGKGYVERLHILAKQIHFYKTKLCVQITPGLGRVGAGSSIRPPKSASATPCFWTPDVLCEPYTVEELHELVKCMGEAAALAKQGGADAVELHAYGGYLLDQFQCSLWNHRTDEYGGDLAGRMKLTLEIIAEMRKRCGPKFPILVKFTPEHGFAGGRTIEEGKEMAKMFEAAGVDALHIDYGCYEAWYNAIPTVYQSDATQIHLAKQIREVVSIPVLSQGKLGIPEVAEKALQDGCADFVGLGHTMLCEPHWVEKVKKGHYYDLAPCIGCNECLHLSFSGVGSQCAINPRCGFEGMYPLTKVSGHKRLLVVGGGPGGMQAAITAAERGIEVELWEKASALGGSLLAAGAPSFKLDVKRYVDYMSGKVLRSGVNVRYNMEATVEKILNGKFDAVILAAGAEPLKLPIPGFDGPNVVAARDFMPKKEAADVCVVVGGGPVGCEAALMIQKDCGKKAILIEMLDDILLTADHARNMDLKLREMMQEEQIETICGAQITKIEDGKVTYLQKGEAHTILCDQVVISSGSRANHTLEEQLEAAGVSVYTIGENKKAPGKVFYAVHDGYHAARLLFEE